jgi:hypothetical protein
VLDDAEYAGFWPEMTTRRGLVHRVRSIPVDIAPFDLAGAKPKRGLDQAIDLQY